MKRTRFWVGVLAAAALLSGRIRVESADCPDQVCVDQGWISDGTVPVVCLPNRLVIQIEGGGDGLDSATG